MATDLVGNIYVSDFENRMVMKVDPKGTLTVVAGNGVAGFAGDGGPATRAALFLPRDVSVDGQGNLYLHDYEGSRGCIRKVGKDGRITTVARDVFGDVAVDPVGNIYIAERTININRIRRVTPDGIITTIAGRRMTRGQDGSLLLSCGALASPTFCRFIPALSLRPWPPL